MFLVFVLSRFGFCFRDGRKSLTFCRSLFLKDSCPPLDFLLLVENGYQEHRSLEVSCQQRGREGDFFYIFFGVESFKFS